VLDLIRPDDCLEDRKPRVLIHNIWKLQLMWTKERSHLLPLSDSSHAIELNTHVICLLNWSCEACRFIYLRTMNGHLVQLNEFILRKATVSASRCALCMLANLVWNYFFGTPHSVGAYVSKIVESKQGRILLTSRNEENEEMVVELHFTSKSVQTNM
jgi:hypothetical protein